MSYNLRKKVIFHNEPSKRGRERFLFMLNVVANKMSKAYGPKKTFARLGEIHVYGAKNRSDNMIKYNAIGLAFFDGRIETSYYDGPGENAVAAMELAHNALLSLLNVTPNSGLYDEFNNWIHFAANAPTPTLGNRPGETYLPRATFRFGTWADKLLGRWEKPRFMWYDMGLIMRDGPLMNRALANGTAPKGVHAYWDLKEARFAELKADGIIPGSLESMAEHESLLAMGTWDHPHYDGHGH